MQLDTSILIPEIAGSLLRSKWPPAKAVRAGLAVGGSISRSILDDPAAAELDLYDKDMGASLAP